MEDLGRSPLERYYGVYLVIRDRGQDEAWYDTQEGEDTMTHADDLWRMMSQEERTTLGRRLEEPGP